MLPRHELDAIRFENLAETVLVPGIVRHRQPLAIRAWQTTDRPGPGQLDLDAFTSVDVGWRWGPPWSTAWFHLVTTVPEAFDGCRAAIQFSSGTEATFWHEGVPFHGLDANRDLVRLPDVVRSGDVLEFLVEAACTLPLGASTFWWDAPEVQARWREERPGRVESASLVVLDEAAWRLHEAWDVARRVLLALPANSEDSARLLEGLNRIASGIAGGVDDADATRAEIESLLTSTGSADGGPCVAVGHAHIDTAWLWPLAETRRKCLRTFSTMLRLMERYDDFRFLCSQPQQYAWIEEDSPELFEQITARVREGRWEAGGAMWIEPDCNVPSGESLVRQILHGTNWWQDRFGDAAPQRHLYLPDTFGFPASLPQIIRLAGLDTFITNKISWCETNRFPHVTFNWKGIDGTEVLSHLTPGHNYNSPIYPSDVLAGHGILMAQPRPRPDAWLQPYGYGDGGGGPTDSMIERIGHSGRCTGLPGVRHGRADDFCGLLHEQAQQGGALPSWDGDLYLELHRGTYTSQSWLKMANRVGEDDLRCIEAMTCGGPRAADAASLRDTLDETWKLVLLNQFHDILPGSSIHEVYQDARSQYDRIQSRCREELETASRAWSSHLGEGVACFNPASTDRSGVVDVDGTPTWVASVPAMGGRVVGASSEEVAPVEIDGHHLRNGLIEATLDTAGRVTHLACRGASRGVTAPDRPLGQLVLYEDQPRRWEAWDIDADYVDTATLIESVAEMEIIESHPLRAIVEFRRALGTGSRLVQRYVLRADSPRLDVEYLVDWQEDQRLLRLSCPTDIRTRMGTVGIQFGVQERPTHRNTSWEQACFEFPGHRFMDLSEPGRGLAVLDDGRYGRSMDGDTLGLSLLRAPRMPDPEADRGTHRFTVAFMPHEGDWRAAGVWGEAEALCRPLRLLGSAQGTETESAPFRLQVDGGAHVEIAAFKPAEQSGARVLRLVEVHGGAGDVEINWSHDMRSVQAVDLHESTPVEVDLAHDGNRTRIGIRPFQIVTLLVDGG
ncbi:MAG: glycosyl hydrolase-related protein [Phycisphaerales bacterium]|nr:glycosyl hydrolase-related protein [Phycisphaerales bacterium]